MFPRSPGCGGHGARARVRKGPLPPNTHCHGGSSGVGRTRGPGTMHKDREGASLVALGTEAWRWAGTWTQESAVGGDPMRAAPSASPTPPCSREAEPQCHHLIGEDREGCVQGTRASGQSPPVTQDVARGVTHSGQAWAARLLKGWGSGCEAGGATAGLGDEFHLWGLRMSFGGRWPGWGQGCLEPLSQSPRSTTVTGPGFPSEPEHAPLPTDLLAQSGLSRDLGLMFAK